MQYCLSKHAQLKSFNILVKEKKSGAKLSSRLTMLFVRDRSETMKRYADYTFFTAFIKKRSWFFSSMYVTRRMYAIIINIYNTKKRIDKLPVIRKDLFHWRCARNFEAIHWLIDLRKDVPVLKIGAFVFAWNLLHVNLNGSIDCSKK